MIPQRNLSLLSYEGPLPAAPARKEIKVDVTIRERIAFPLAKERDRARNEPRDLYDIWFLMNGKHVDLSIMTAAITDKLAFRGRTKTDGVKN